MTDPKVVARASFRLIETGDEELAQQIIAPDYLNQEAEDDPEDGERQQRGPAGFLATSRWLRDAFSNLRFELQETVARWGFERERVGLVTGHRTVNPNAQIKVVVAEVLLNRLLHPEAFDFSAVGAVCCRSGGWRWC